MDLCVAKTSLDPHRLIAYGSAAKILPDGIDWGRRVRLFTSTFEDIIAEEGWT